MLPGNYGFLGLGGQRLSQVEWWFLSDRFIRASSNSLLLHNESSMVKLRKMGLLSKSHPQAHELAPFLLQTLAVPEEEAPKNNYQRSDGVTTTPTHCSEDMGGCGCFGINNKWPHDRMTQPSGAAG